MADCHIIKTPVKLTFLNMNSARRYCRCCYSPNKLETLCGTFLEVYILICDPQDPENCENRILACIRCREFLEEVNRFKMKGHPVDEIIQDIKPLKSELMLGYTIDGNPSQMSVKTEIVDEYDTFVMNSDSKNVQKVSETNSDSELMSISVNKDDRLCDLVKPAGDNLLIELYNVKYCHTNEFAHKTMVNVNPIREANYAATNESSSSSKMCKMEVDCELEDAEEKTTVKPFSCELCTFTTSFKRYLKSHMLVHTNERPYTCDHCNFSAKSRDQIIKHIRGHSSERDKPHKCSECSYRTTAISNLKRHVVNRHRDEKPFTCEQCNYRGKSKERLSAHLRSHLDDCDKPYECSECSYKTTTRGFLRTHIANKHRDEKPFSCDQCDYCAKEMGSLTVHKRSHLNDCDKPYKCSECSYITTTMTKLKSHTVYRHSDEKPFKCDQCDYRAKKKGALTIHKRNHLNDCNKPYECSECSYKTTTMACLKRHAVYKHSDEKPLFCDQCDYRCKVKAQLARHKILHLKDDESPFKCGQCSFKFLSQGELKTHVSYKHSDEKPLSCDQCNYRCKFKLQLIRHKKIHLKKPKSKVRAVQEWPELPVNFWPQT